MGNIFIKLDDLPKESEISYLKLRLARKNLIFESEQIGLTNDELKVLDINNEHIRFQTLEQETNYLLYVSPYNQVIKHKH